MDCMLWQLNLAHCQNDIMVTTHDMSNMSNLLYLSLLLCINAVIFLLNCKSLFLSLILLQATDEDLIINITYRIRTEAARQLFAVDRITGALSVLQSLDFEALGRDGANYTFQVEALDYESVLSPGIATVTVRIMVRQLALLNLVPTPNIFFYWTPKHTVCRNIFPAI